MSFRLRLVISFLLVVLCSLGFFYFWTSRQIDSLLLELSRTNLDRRTALLSAVIDPETPQLDEFVDRLSVAGSLRITVIARDGTVLADSSFSGDALAALENHAGRPEVVEAWETGKGFSRRYSTSVSQFMLYAARVLPGGSSIIRVAEETDELETRIAESRYAFSLLAGLLFLTGGLAVWFISRRMSSSLELLSEAAVGISSGHFVSKIPVKSTDEVGRLARQMEELSIRLEHQLVLLESERDHLNAVLNSLTEGVLVTDDQGRISGTNPALDAMFSRDASALGKTPLEVVGSREVSQAIERTMLSGERCEAEVHSSGRVFLARFAPIGRRPVGVVAVFLDITEHRRLEGVRKDFISNVSHELKTPLTSIQGYAETLLQEELTAVHTGFVEKIFRNASQLSDMIEELFSLARLERGERRLQMEEVPFDGLMAALQSEFAEEFRAKSIAFRYENVSDSAVFTAARGYIHRAFRNLIENAVKYTDAGAVTVRMSRNGDDFLFTVRDTGIGISAEHLDRIFERFYRVDKDRSRRTGGSGIGLAIVKHIVQLHNGRVWAESRLDVGTTIHLAIPAPQTARVV